MVFSPHDESELDTVRAIVSRACAYAMDEGEWAGHPQLTGCPGDWKKVWQLIAVGHPE